MLNYTFNEDTIHQYTTADKKKGTKGADEEHKVKREPRIKIPKLYEFQFFDNFEELL
jgi:hypothetical protein